MIHGIFSSYFGDWEWDIGKSVRWSQYFFDTEYAVDINLGDRSRGYFISWDATFPEVNYTYFSAFPFFSDLNSAAQWRRDSFLAAKERLNYAPDDWVMFVDTTEGLSIDTQYPPVDFLPPTPASSESPNAVLLSDRQDEHNPFQTYITQEIDNAGGSDTIYMPMWAFVEDSAAYTVPLVIDTALQTIIDALPAGGYYNGLTKEELLRINTSYTTTAYASYVFAGYSPRLLQVSALEDPGFDWTSLDTYFSNAYISSTSKAKSEIALSMITYAYAQWAADPLDTDPETGHPDSEAHDIGFQMRKLISRVRPISGLPFASWPPNDTAASYYGYKPPSIEATGDTLTAAGGPEFSSAFSDDFLNFKRREVPLATHNWPPDYPELRTTLYDNVFRDNPRDGLFYYDRELGPVPWNYVSNQPAIDPTTWVYDESFSQPVA